MRGIAPLRWLLFLWGIVMCAVMVNYARYWFPDPHNVRFNEAQMGYLLGFVYGLPAWLGLPAFAWWRRKVAPRWEQAVILSPPAVALLVFAVGWYLEAS